MLELLNVRIERDTFTLAADISVIPGSRVAVIGPSGAGKSTLLSGLAGFDPLASGDIRWNGASIAKATPADRPITIVFQDHNLFPHLSVAQNVGLGRHPSLRLGRQDKADIARVLERVELAGLEDRKPAGLSGGQISRVALARALLRERPILLLDEPFAALGPALKAEMLDLVEDMATEAGMTVLLISHDPTDAIRFSSHTILLTDGVASAPQETDALFANPPQNLKDYLGETK